MKRYVIYARFSSDQQNPMSSADQISLCKEYITKHGDGILMKTYQDDGYSGANPNRPDLIQLTQDAQQGLFDVIVVTNQDRIHRNQIAMLTTFNIFEYLGITIHSLQEQQITDMSVALQSYISANYLKTLSQNVKRGHRGAINRKVLPMRVVFGYQQPKKGKPWTIQPDEAQIVQQIFTMKSQGIGIKKIVDVLNAPEQHIKYNTRADTWISKHVERILSRPIYKGIFVWGARRKVRNPITGKDEYIQVPKEDHIIQHIPELKIIDAHIFDSVQPPQQSPKQHMKQRTQHTMVYVLYNKVFCAVCGSKMYISHSQKKLYRYQYVACPNKQCNSPYKWVHLHELTNNVLKMLFADIQHNKQHIQSCIQKYTRVTDTDFQKMKFDIIQRVLNTHSFIDFQAYLDTLQDAQPVPMEQIICRLKWAVRGYDMDKQDPISIDIIRLFIKSVYVKRTDARNSRKYVFTYEIDVQAITRNLEKLRGL